MYSGTEYTHQFQSNSQLLMLYLSTLLPTSMTDSFVSLLISRGSVCNGALNDVKAEFALFAVGLVPDAQAAMTVDAALSRLTDALSPEGRPAEADCGDGSSLALSELGDRTFSVGRCGCG